MSDLYEVYNLPAPRQRTFFSSSDSLTRARFPNFLLDDDPASSCRHFVNGLLRWQFSTTIGAQFIFLCAWQAVTLALLTAVICIKIYHRKFWVVRLARTKKGRMIAYNTSESISRSLLSHLVQNADSCFCSFFVCCSHAAVCNGGDSDVRSASASILLARERAISEPVHACRR